MLEVNLISLSEGEFMEKSSFADLKRDLENACEFVRSFTLDRPGFTMQDRFAGIQRLKAQCDRMKALGSGLNAVEAATAETLARTLVVEAERHLALLGKKE
jgi:hypothetical protein